MEATWYPDPAGLSRLGLVWRKPWDLKQEPSLPLVTSSQAHKRARQLFAILPLPSRSCLTLISLLCLFLLMVDILWLLCACFQRKNSVRWSPERLRLYSVCPRRQSISPWRDWSHSKEEMGGRNQGSRERSKKTIKLWPQGRACTTVGVSRLFSLHPWDGHRIVLILHTAVESHTGIAPSACPLSPILPMPWLGSTAAACVR